ncbi:MAG: flagellar motor switch protein FliN [Bryobacterales bacterium]|nr:flagellar motor switch protein FliN [Bryobacterales bacterium]
MTWMPDPNAAPDCRGLAEEFASRLALAATAVTGQDARPGRLSPAPSETPDGAWWYALPFSGPHGARLFLGIPDETSDALCPETEGRPKARLEMAGRAARGMAEWLRGRWNAPVSSGSAEVMDAPPPAVAFSRLELELDGRTLPLLVGSSEALQQALGQPLPAAPLNPKTLDLLMEVELPVSLSFGRACLPLREVLKLTSGSIVELNRAVGEPVELIINNAVIARGEVVVVEGNYGVKITEIISRQERLRTVR